MVVVVGMLALALVLLVELVEVVVDYYYYYFEVGKDSFCKAKKAGTV